MLVAYFSPLAPTIILLLSAFILPLLIKNVAHPLSQRFSGLIFLALVGLSLLTTRLNAPPHIISSWLFATSELPTTLALQLTRLNFAFLGLTWWLLLIALLMTLPDEPDGAHTLPFYPRWFILGATASLVFISANEVTLGYAVITFDLCAAFYWFQRQQPHLGLGRLFLGIFTAIALIVAMPLAAVQPNWGLYLIGLALWLRFLLYPILELDQPLIEIKSNLLTSLNHLIYFGLSFAVAVYIIIAVLQNPLPLPLRWLIVITMLWQGILVWLKPSTDYKSALIRLVFNQAALLLLVDPLPPEIIIAYTIGLLLGLTALWVTPRVTKLPLSQVWLYLSAAAATLTLLGLPFSLGWSVKSAVYQLLFQASTPQAGLVIVAVLAEGLVLSSLLLYWQFVFEADLTPTDGLIIPKNQWLANFMTWLPFLIPGVAIISLSTLLQYTLPLTDFNHTRPVFIALSLTWLAAGGLGYYRPEILAYLRVSERSLTPWLTFRWFTDGLKQIEALSRLLLHIQIILEGRHYFGWTFFVALVGFLAILLK